MRTRPESPPEKLTKSGPLDVTANQHGDGRSSWYELLFEQRRDRDRAARLDAELHSVEQHPHGAHERVVVDRDDVVEVLLVVGERHVADLHSKQSVSQTAGVVERDGLSRGARSRKLWCAGRLDADHSRVRQAKLDRR